MTKHILYKTQFVLSFSILLLFAVMLILFQPAFSYTQATEWSRNPNTIKDVGLIHTGVSKNQQFHFLVDKAMDEQSESFGIFAIPKKQNREIVDVQYYYPPPYYSPPPLSPSPPSYYLNDNFVLTVRLILEDDDTRDTVADFYVYAGGEQKYIDSGDEFKDDGKAKVTFVLDRDALNNREEATIETTDGSWSQTWYYYTSNSNEATINQRFN